MSANEYIVVNGKRYAAIVPVSYKADGTPNLNNAGNPAVNTTVSNKGTAVPTDMTNSLNRDHTSITAGRVSHTWTAGENVRQITITARNSANPVEVAATEFTQVPADIWLAVTFNAPDDTTANTWLSQVDGVATASKVYMVRIGHPRTFNFSAPLTRIDYKRAIGVLSANVVIEAEAP